MATLKELLGTSYKDGMTYAEVESALQGKNLADLSSGGYVSKTKYDDDTKALKEYKQKVETEAERTNQAVSAAKEVYKQELEKEFNGRLTAQQRKQAKEKAYSGLNDEQKGIFDAMLKDDDLKLDEKGETFSNFEEIAKPIREKYKTLFPVDPDGSKGKAGLPSGNGEGTKGGEEFSDFRKM